jgi:hypothetical protein
MLNLHDNAKFSIVSFHAIMDALQAFTPADSPLDFMLSNVNVKNEAVEKSNSLLWTTLPAKERGRLCLNQD